MRNFRIIYALVVSLITVAPVLASADPGVPNPVYRSLESGKDAHDAGVVSGIIEGVDYSGGLVTVRTRHRGSINVSVVPSTAIYRGGQYGTLSDLRRGQSVEISVYEVGGRLVAQTIRLK